MPRGDRGEGAEEGEGGGGGEDQDHEEGHGGAHQEVQRCYNDAGLQPSHAHH